MSDERKCLICGKTYRYCPSCQKFSQLPRWMFLFDSQNCHDVYEVLNDYGAKAITRDEARKRLSKLDLSNIDKKYKKTINEIMATPKVAPTKNRKRNNRKVDSEQDYNTKDDTI